MEPTVNKKQIVLYALVLLPIFAMVYVGYVAVQLSNRVNTLEGKTILINSSEPVANAGAGTETQGRIISLQSEKKDVGKVETGKEAGISVDIGEPKIIIGDIITLFRKLS